MVVLIRNKVNAMGHLEKGVIAITETEGYIELTYDDEEHGIIKGSRYPVDTYKVEKITSERRTEK